MTVKTVTTNSRSLAAVLATLAKAIHKKSTLEALHYVKVRSAPMQDPKQGVHLFLETTDLDTYAICTIPGHGDTFDPVLIEHDALTKIIKKCDGNVDLSVKNKDVDVVYEVAGQKIEASMPTLDVEQFPPVPDVDGEEFPLPAKFGNAYRRSMPFRSTDETRYILNGVCIDNRAGRDAMVATDGKRMFIETGFGGVMKADRHIIIPTNCNILANGLLDKTGWTLTCKWAKHEDGKETGFADWILLRTDGWWIYTKVPAGDYPTWVQVIPATGSHKAVVTMDEAGAEKLVDILNAMPDWSDGKHEPTARLELIGGKLVIHTRSGREKFAHATVACASTEGDAVIALNRRYLMDALRMKIPRIEVTDELSPLVFRGADQMIIVMPMRMS